MLLFFETSKCLSVFLLYEILISSYMKQLTELFGVTYMVIIAHIATIVRCLAYTILTPDSFFTNVSALSLQTLHGT